MSDRVSKGDQVEITRGFGKGERGKVVRVLAEGYGQRERLEVRTADGTTRNRSTASVRKLS